MGNTIWEHLDVKEIIAEITHTAMDVLGQDSKLSTWAGSMGSDDAESLASFIAAISVDATMSALYRYHELMQKEK